MYLKEMWRCRTGSSALVWRPLAGLYEHCKDFRTFKEKGSSLVSWATTGFWKPVVRLSYLYKVFYLFWIIKHTRFIRGTGIVHSEWRLGRGWTPGVDSSQGKEILLHYPASRSALVSTQSPIQWEPNALSLGAKRSGSESENSLPSSAEVENGGAIITLPLTSSRRGA
jgi:hypothetical protein